MRRAGFTRCSFDSILLSNVILFQQNFNRISTEFPQSLPACLQYGLLGGVWRTDLRAFPFVVGRPLHLGVVCEVSNDLGCERSLELSPAMAWDGPGISLVELYALPKELVNLEFLFHLAYLPEDIEDNDGHRLSAL
jgi:hypothetical protein